MLAILHLTHVTALPRAATGVRAHASGAGSIPSVRVNTSSPAKSPD
jgi:hypothetical protein